jgi:hypothetical protein
MRYELPNVLLEEVHQLGEPAEVHYARRVDLLIEFAMALVWFLLALVPTLAGVSFFIIWQVSNNSPAPGWYVLLASTAGVLMYLGGRRIVRAWRQWGLVLVVAPQGLACTRSHWVVVYRWEDVAQFFYRIVDHSVHGVYTHTTVAYRFRHANGHQFCFREYLDRPDRQPLADVVNAGMLRVQLPLLRGHLEAHQAVGFGPLTMEPEGLRLGQSWLPYKELGRIWLAEGKLRIRKLGKLLNWCSLRIDRVPNWYLLLALVGERAGSGESDAALT